jgi:hypothetical protein
MCLLCSKNVGFTDAVSEVNGHRFYFGPYPSSTIQK